MERNKVLKSNGRRHIPLSTGPYIVGCTDIMTSYSKFGVFSRIFYPSNDQSALDRYLQWPLWLPHKEYLNGYAIRRGVPHWCCKLWYKIMVGKLHIPVVWQASLQQAEEKYPVIVFSHGLSAWRTSYSAICSELASYGFVVAAVEHRDFSASASFYKKEVRMSSIGNNPGSSLCNLEDALNVTAELDSYDFATEKCVLVKSPSISPFCYINEWMLYQPITNEDEVSFRNKQVTYRAKECSAVLDMLEDLNIGRHVANDLDPSFDLTMFQGQLDLKNATIIGHSFGGATGFYAMATELRFKAAVLLDPYMLPFYEDQSFFSSISQPFLCLLVKNYQTKASLKLLKNLQDMHDYGEFVVIKKAYHRDLCDTPFIPKFRPALSSKLGRRIERFEALDIASGLIFQFLSQQLGKNVHLADRKLELLKQKYLVLDDCFSKPT